MDNEEKDKEKEITSLEELELVNIPKDEIYAVADLLSSGGSNEE